MPYFTKKQLKSFKNLNYPIKFLFPNTWLELELPSPPPFIISSKACE